MIHSSKGMIKTVLNIIPALAVGLVGALMIEPLLSKSYQKTLTHASLWHQLIHVQGLIVAIGAITSLLIFILERHGSPRSKRHSHKHHPE
jgi:ABC-type phosphate transport system permease subunit